MALRDIENPASVLRALSEFDQLGREDFLAKYGFGESRRYFLVRNGKRYDSKAIVGAAHAFEFPQLGHLGPGDFSGGEATVQKKLEELGFGVEVLETVEDNGDKNVGVAGLRPIHEGQELDATFSIEVSNGKAAWLVLSFGDDRQYAGNAGYDDELAETYRYDSNVGNWKRVSAGDLLLLRDREQLIGVARVRLIQSFDEGPAAMPGMPDDSSEGATLSDAALSVQRRSRIRGASCRRGPSLVTWCWYL